jgi:hypothetical protein
LRTATKAPTTSASTKARRYHAVWQWRLELESSQRFVQTWSALSASSLQPTVQVRLANVAWALAGLERSYDLLMEAFHRADQARTEGVPPVMAFLSGPYENSLEYLLGASLWLSLGEVIAHFRTVVERFSHLKGPARRGLLPVDVATVDAEIAWLRSLTLPALATSPVTNLANRVLHEAWHPADTIELSIPLYFRENGHVDLTEDDLREQLNDLVEGTLRRVTLFVVGQTEHKDAPVTPTDGKDDRPG